MSEVASLGPEEPAEDFARPCALTPDCAGTMRLQQSPFSSAEWACARCRQRRLVLEVFEPPQVKR